MTHIETPILHRDKYREQTEEEVIETLHLALKEAKERLAPITLIREIMKEIDPQEIRKQLSSLKRNKYERYNIYFPR